MKDAVLDVDWAAHWRTLVTAREVRAGPAEGDWWAPRARSFARQMVGTDWFMDVLEPWLRPSTTLIDVGAGTGRYAGPLAERLDWVTAVEPSESMRQHIPAAPNLTVIGSTWEDAEPARADLAICVHVLYPVAEAAPFLEKLDRSARERVFVVMRDSPHVHPAEVLSRPERTREPWLRDCLMLLRQLGVAPELVMTTYETRFRYDGLEEAMAQCRSHLGRLWDEARAREWLTANLRRDEDGTFTYGGEVTSGVLHWKPRT